MDGTENTRIQYIMVDSDLVEPRIDDPSNPPANSSSSFTLDLNQESNLHCECINQVIGIKLVDFYITQVGNTGGGTGIGAKYIDVVCVKIFPRSHKFSMRGTDKPSHEFHSKDRFQEVLRLYNTINNGFHLIGKRHYSIL